MEISGNTILITGGGSGIGRALAEALLAENNVVIIAGRRLSILEVAAENAGIEFERFDATDHNAIPDFAAKLVVRFPSLNVVINNAGIMVAEDLTADAVGQDVIEATISTNLLAPLCLNAALIPHLKKQRSAAIVMLSSGLAFVPLAATPTYSATKAAIHSYSQSLRFQLRHTAVDVIEIAPPAVATDLMPGHAENPNAMPLQAFIDETIELLKKQPHGPEILVKRVGFQRNAERDHRYNDTFTLMNAARAQSR